MIIRIGRKYNMRLWTCRVVDILSGFEPEEPGSIPGRSVPFIESAYKKPCFSHFFLIVEKWPEFCRKSLF